MRKRRKGKGLVRLLIVLLIALAIVVGVVVFKEKEYKDGVDYYDSLRGGDEEA